MAHAAKKATKLVRKKKTTRKKTTGKTQAELGLLLKEVVKERKKLGLIKDGSAIGRVRAYDMHARFFYGDKVEHPEFGTGVVHIIKANKVEVVFPNSTRILAHDISPHSNDTDLSA